jgi:hypothetical protein
VRIHFLTQIAVVISSSYPILSYIIIIMQGPPEDNDDEGSISMENEREDPTLSDTFAVRRKAAKRTLPWDLAADELELVSPQQAEDIRATKRPRLEESSFALTDEAAAELSSHDTVVSLPAADADHADADPVKGYRATGSWTPQEDAKLNSAPTNTSKKTWGKEYKTDWAAVAALVPSRTTQQCRDRWRHALAPSFEQRNIRTGTWAEDEDIKLKDAVQTHGDKNWVAIAALVPSRTKILWRDRWYYVLAISIEHSNRRSG